ncbi:LuxR C-terminal-related transcriptional regulator [Psychrobacillus sp.]|uniref:LuxR C-terminal-related transcriptional regulator n=1 Tax=Psychrobacillus sp. TaxID=1871623 RepID=UPI0028BE5195|nr:LuxR C-terminal-related transcriptional regulator [Psychrobacillus sp.]
MERPRLYDNFSNSTLKKITILRAPAGYGKTTLLSQWLKQTEEPIAWLSIDRADNDPIRYWTFLFQAVAKTCQSDVDKVIAPLLHSRDAATYEFLIDSFLNEISVTEKALHIAIDDYHLIENDTIHQMMTRLIEHLPAHVHIYLATRTVLPLPIAKWRVKQWVQEFNIEHLRFTYQETKQFFSLKNSTFVNQLQLQDIQDKTEGWIAGLLLTNLANVNETHPNSELDQPFVSEFLWQEIIHSLPQETQDFLLRTSLLHELEPAICDQLTGRTDSAELLAYLVEKGLFTVRIQFSKPVFRYHHLFAEALQAELFKQYSSQEIKLAIEKAAQLIYMQGYYVSAIELALKHKLYEQAQLWITKHLIEISSSGQTATFMRWLHQLRSNHLTVPYEMLIIGFQNAITIGEIETANSLMQELEMRQQTEQWMEQKEHAAMASIFERAKAYAIVALGGDLKAAKKILRKQLTKQYEASHWDKTPVIYNSFEYKLLRTSLASKGKLPSIEESEDVAKLFRDTDFNTLYVTPFICGVFAENLYERNFLEAAQKELEMVIQLGHQSNDPGLFIPMYLLKAKVYVQQKQISSAHGLLIEVIENVSEKHWRTSLQIMQAYCYIAGGDILNAEMLLQATKSKQPFWMLVYARLLLKKEQPNDALSILIQVKTKALQDQQIATILEATVLEVICHNRLGNTQIALDILHEALVLAEKFYYVRTFLDEKEIIPLLDTYFNLEILETKWDAIPTHYFSYLQENIETSPVINKLLTPREKEIFDILTEGSSNYEIARQLQLSEGTIRVYLSTIYRKLGVNSRAKAILLKKQ